MSDTKRILIVDDENHMVRFTSHVLKKVGADFLHASSGSEALEVLQEEEGVNLMLVDFQMPGLSGVETIQEVRKLPGKEKLPVIMLTARGQASIKDEADGLGVAAFVTKPFSPVELMDIVTRTLED